VIRKEFVLTDKQLQLIRDFAKEKGISQNEALRRILDKSIDLGIIDNIIIKKMDE